MARANRTRLNQNDAESQTAVTQYHELIVAFIEELYITRDQ